MEGKDRERSGLESCRCGSGCVGFRSDLRRQQEQPTGAGHQGGMLVHVLALLAQQKATLALPSYFYYLSYFSCNPVEHPYK